MAKEKPLALPPYIVLRRDYRTLPSSEFHLTDQESPRKSICGIFPGVAFVFVDVVPEELRPCGECVAIAERRKRL